MKKRNYILILSLGTLLNLVTLTGCGNFGGNTRFAPKSAMTSTHSQLEESSGTQDLFACSSEESNIKPSYDSNIDLTGYFTACQSGSTYQDTVIRTDAYNSIRVCVFPAQYIDPQHIYAKPDKPLNMGGKPMSQCLSIDRAGVVVSFANTNYNMLLVTPEANRDLMTSCLTQGTWSNCPTYSYGIFR